MKARSASYVTDEEIYKLYLHAPPHLFRTDAIYFVTASTVDHVRMMADDERKRQLKESLDFLFDKHGWALIAWVILSNHYHVLMEAPEEALSLSRLIGDLHKFTARKWNDEDGTPGRNVWYQYRDTCLTYERSFYARFNYIHWNPVKHGYARNPEDYEFSSYRSYMELEKAQIQKIEEKYPWDRLKGIGDEF